MVNEFKFVEDNTDYDKIKSPPKRKQKPNTVESKTTTNEELYKTFHSFLDNYSKAYEYKLFLMNDDELFNELFNLLQDVNNLSPSVYETDDETLNHSLNRSGYAVSQSRFNTCLRVKVELIKNEMKLRRIKTFTIKNENEIDINELFFKEFNEINDMIRTLECIEHNVIGIVYSVLHKEESVRHKTIVMLKKIKEIYSKLKGVL